MQLSGQTTFEAFNDFDDMPDFARVRLAILLTAPSGFRDERIGRRIAEDAFWLFY